MFHYTERDLFDRCGVRTVFYDGKIAESTGKFAYVGGEEIPLIKVHPSEEAKFTRYLCLRTYRGYIPVERIESFKDIFHKRNYLQDATEWILPYHEQFANDDDKAKVKQLSLALGRHWKQ